MTIHLRRELRKLGVKPRGILHVGAHEGQEDGMYRKMGATPVYVEANPEVFDRLQEKLPNRECHMVAVSDHHGTATLHVTSADQSSSLLALKKHAEIYPDIVETKTVEVRCTTIDHLVQGRHSEFDVLVLDIQGAELIALQGAGDLLGHVVAIMSEVNREEMYAGCAQLSEIDSYLKSFGFERVKTSFAHHQSWGDALYAKSTLVNQSWLKNQVKRLTPRWVTAKAA